MIRKLNGALLAIAALAFGSCRPEPDDPTGLEGVDVLARVEPVELAPGDSAAVIAVFHNTRATPMRLGFAMGCPFYLTIVESASEERVAFEGSNYLCLAAPRYLDVAARDSLVWEQPIVARVNGQPAPLGRYVARLEFTGVSPELEAGFSVD